MQQYLNLSQLAAWVSHSIANEMALGELERWLFILYVGYSCLQMSDWITYNGTNPYFRYEKRFYLYYFLVDDWTFSFTKYCKPA